MDKTVFQLDIPFLKIVHKVGAKNKTIKVQGQDRCRVSIILSIYLKGDKKEPIMEKSIKNY